jgi:hypothetical protein
MKYATATRFLLKALLLSGTMIAATPGLGVAQTTEKKGTTPYVTHFIFIPVKSIDVGELGTATLLEAVGTTQNLKGEKMLDKMSAHCTALNVSSGDKKYIDGACVSFALCRSPLPIEHSGARSKIRQFQKGGIL